jgi:ribosome-associated translation inhibitor RaiA
MQVPLQIAFKNMDHDAAAEAEIREKAAKLEQFSDRITSCHVTVEAPHTRHLQGSVYRVRIHLALPAHQGVVVDREPEVDQSHADLRVAIRDAFKAARRQLQDAMRQLQGAVKTHALQQ